MKSSVQGEHHREEDVVTPGPLLSLPLWDWRLTQPRAGGGCWVGYQGVSVVHCDISKRAIWKQETTAKLPSIHFILWLSMSRFIDKRSNSNDPALFCKKTRDFYHHLLVYKSCWMCWGLGPLQWEWNNFIDFARDLTIPWWVGSIANSVMYWLYHFTK